MNKAENNKSDHVGYAVRFKEYLEFSRGIGLVVHFKCESDTDKNIKKYVYRMEKLVIDTDDYYGEPRVLYTSLETGLSYVRKASEFFGKVDKDKYPEIKEHEFRFTPIDSI